MFQKNRDKGVRQAGTRIRLNPDQYGFTYENMSKQHYWQRYNSHQCYHNTAFTPQKPKRRRHLPFVAASYATPHYHEESATLAAIHFFAYAFAVVCSPRFARAFVLPGLPPAFFFSEQHRVPPQNPPEKTAKQRLDRRRRYRRSGRSPRVPANRCSHAFTVRQRATERAAYEE
jgi:hypothetical protein